MLCIKSKCIIRQENNFTQMGSIILAIRLASIGAHLAVLLDIQRNLGTADGLANPSYYYDHLLENDAAAAKPPVACVPLRRLGVYSPSSSESL